MRAAKIYATTPATMRKFWHEAGAVVFRENEHAHRRNCSTPADTDGHQYQRLYFTRSRRWGFLCVHPFGRTKSHAAYVTSTFARAWLARNGFDPDDAQRYARAQLAGRAPQTKPEPLLAADDQAGTR